MIAQSIARTGFRRPDKYDRIERALQDFLDGSRPRPGELPREVEEIVCYIHDHLFDSSLNVNLVKLRCRLRNNNVSTRFRKVVGLGIREYIEQLRLEAAGSLLSERDLEVYLVAMAVGYQHQETFCRAFQRHFGYTASERRLRAVASAGCEKIDQEKPSTLNPPAPVYSLY